MVREGNVNAVPQARRSQKSECRNQNAEVRIAGAIRRAADGDTEAYAEIYPACDRALRAFVGRRYGRLGADFTEEVAIRTHEFAFSHLNRYSSDHGASSQTWLCWQARSVASEVVRERFGRQLVQYDDGVHEAWAVSATGPADVYEDERLSRVLREEFDALPEDMRRCITLYDNGIPGTIRDS